VAAINLCIPRGYKRFSYAESDLPRLPKGVTLRVVDKDLGPATKSYRPDCVFCDRGRHLSHPRYANNSNWVSHGCPQTTPIRKGFRYGTRRILSLAQWKSLKWLKSGYIDILEGWGGVVFRPEFFDDFAWQIPDILWTVDDVWLSGCLERQGIPI